MMGFEVPGQLPMRCAGGVYSGMVSRFLPKDDERPTTLMTLPLARFEVNACLWYDEIRDKYGAYVYDPSNPHRPMRVVTARGTLFSPLRYVDKICSVYKGTHILYRDNTYAHHIYDVANDSRTPLPSFRDGMYTTLLLPTLAVSFGKDTVTVYDVGEEDREYKLAEEYHIRPMGVYVDDTQHVIDDSVVLISVDGALLTIKFFLQEYRRSRANGDENPLRHVVLDISKTSMKVVDDAFYLVKRVNVDEMLLGGYGESKRQYALLNRTTRKTLILNRPPLWYSTTRRHEDLETIPHWFDALHNVAIIGSKAKLADMVMFETLHRPSGYAPAPAPVHLGSRSRARAKRNRQGPRSRSRSRSRSRARSKSRTRTRPHTRPRARARSRSQQRRRRSHSRSRSRSQRRRRSKR